MTRYSQRSSRVWSKTRAGCPDLPERPRDCGLKGTNQAAERQLAANSSDNAILAVLGVKVSHNPGIAKCRIAAPLRPRLAGLFNWIHRRLPRRTISQCRYDVHASIGSDCRKLRNAGATESFAARMSDQACCAEASCDQPSRRRLMERM